MKNTYVLTMCYDSKFLHYKIENRGVYFFFENGPYMHSLEHLVDHYTRYPDGLRCALGYPVRFATHECLDAGNLFILFSDTPKTSPSCEYY